MRLLVVSQYFWPENFRINDLVAELARRGHEITVLTGLPNYPEGRIFEAYERDPASFSKLGSVEIVRVPLMPRGTGSIRLFLNFLSFAVSGSLLGSWKLRGRKFDAIFVYQVSPVTVGIVGAVLRWLKKAPMAMWVLDLWPDTLEAIGVVRSRFLLAAVGRLISSIYKRCDLIVAQSNSFIPRIERLCRRKVPIAYFPSWAESLFNQGEVAPAPEVPILPGSFNVMFAGNIGEAQDFPSILAAAELLRDQPRIRWLIVGGGRAGAWVSEEIARRGLQANVLMLGRHPLERMPSFYRHADVLLVTLKDEPIYAMTIPGKLQSYLAAGVPVMAMLNGEGAALVERSGAGFTCGSSDPQGLAEAIRRFASLDEATIAAMRAKALQVSAAEFDRDMLIGRLESWLEGLRSGVVPD